MIDRSMIDSLTADQARQLGKSYACFARELFARAGRAQRGAAAAAGGASRALDIEDVIDGDTPIRQMIDRHYDRYQGMARHRRTPFQGFADGRGLACGAGGGRRGGARGRDLGGDL